MFCNVQMFFVVCCNCLLFFFMFILQCFVFVVVACVFLQFVTRVVCRFSVVVCGKVVKPFLFKFGRGSIFRYRILLELSWLAAALLRDSS